MDRVLDLDLDFFVWPVANDRAEDEPRLDSNEFHVKSEQYVRDFLEKRCGLTTAHRIPGRFIVNHVDSFTTWREWMQKGVLTMPFDVVHIDAHADLGSGFLNESPRFFETELLRLPLENRSQPKFGIDAVNSGNYLVAAVANRWLNGLTYVYPTNPNPPDKATIQAFAAMEKIWRLQNAEDEDARCPTDLPPYCFKGGDPNTRRIELKEYPTSDYSLVDSSTSPIHVEPDIPFDWIEENRFVSSGFTHMVLAQSPAYTPNTADTLLKVIGEYFTTT